MHITASCPFCRSAYQVEAALRGKMVRCPNTTCRKAFPVPSEEEQPPDRSAAIKPAPGNSPRSGSVGEMVPMLPTEPAASPLEASGAAKHVSEIIPVAPTAPAKEGQPAEGDWWHAAPPVRSRSEPGNKKQAPAERPPASDTTWWHNAPSARHPSGKTSETPSPSAKTGETPAPPTPASPTKPLRTPAGPPVETQSMPALAPEKSDQPHELPPGRWDPPPVRRGQASESQAETLAEETVAAPADLPEAEFDNEGGPLVSKRRAKFFIFGSSVLIVGLLALGVVLVVQKIVHSEEALSKEARGFYSQGSYGNAQAKYKDLAKRFSTGERAGEYGFMAEWCGVCEAANSEGDLPAAAAQFDQFVKKHKDDPLMRELAGDAAQRLLHLAKTLADRNANPADEKPLQAVQSIEQLRRTVSALRSDALKKDESRRIDADLDRVRSAVALASKRRNVLAAVNVQGKESPIEAIKRARSLLAQMERELPGITAEAGNKLSQLEKAHFASVVYREAKDAPKPRPAAPEDDGETLPFAPLVKPLEIGSAPPNDSIRLALDRGVLYALKQTTGELKWATRVGIDTTVLPLRVAETAITPELFLVLSADTQTLSALAVEGDREPLWEYHIGEPVLGKPIIIEHRAYLADYSGCVHEIELSRGRLLGKWFLGQQLTCGGAREVDVNGDTKRLYFPADDYCIYVLDVKTHRCAAILYDGHPSGSLRSEPVVIPPEGDTAPGYLILNQARGLDAMQLRVFELPLQDPHAAPLPLDPPARLPGWTWFAPKQDGERLAALSDASRLGLFGIRQQGNKDPALFPWLQPDGLDLSPFLRNSEMPARKAPRRGAALLRERGRSQMVHMQGDDLWVLANGRFQQLRLRLAPSIGPQAVPVWGAPLPLGSPLHEAQLSEDRNGMATFYLVTQALRQQTSLATAVDENGHLLWQRQLGLVCQTEPLLLTPPGGGPPLLLALDRGGGLFVLDPELKAEKLRTSRYALAAALSENPFMPPRLLPGADGHTAYEVAATGEGELVVRQIEWAADRRELRVSERKIPLPASPINTVPAGLPAVTNSQLLLPMTDGTANTIRGLSLANGASLEIGPNWNEGRTPVLAPCYLLALGGDRFLTTNGYTGFSVYEWSPEKQRWDRLPVGHAAPRLLEHPVATPPVLLPPVDDQPPRILVADSTGVLHLFALKPDGSLQPGVTWDLGGNLTSGPFIQKLPKGGWRVGCVLDRRRLRWIDPDKAEPLWTYPSDGPAILGQPQWIEDMLVLALQSGKYIGLDPSTGKPRGSGYTLRTSTAPATTPVAFGRGRMFAPLSDGTALLLSVELLKKN